MCVCLSVCLSVCVCVCVCVCLSVWYVILEHEDKNVRAELIWRVLIATIKTPIHISQSKFSFQSLKHTIICDRLCEKGAYGAIIKLEI